MNSGALALALTVVGGEDAGTNTGALLFSFVRGDGSNAFAAAFSFDGTDGTNS
jgi:hypothetical protein